MKHLLLKAINVWPPFLGAGIRVDSIDKALRRIEVSLPLKLRNRNYVGTHYGGSLYSMTDPFYMIMLLEALGRGYIVWDKAATIRFKKPGKGRVRCVFELTDERLAEIKAEADAKGRAEPVFLVQVVDKQGDVVAEVEKKLSVKPKPPKLT
jgi:hypothetical protein